MAAFFPFHRQIKLIMLVGREFVFHTLSNLYSILLKTFHLIRVIRHQSLLPAGSQAVSVYVLQAKGSFRLSQSLISRWPPPYQTPGPGEHKHAIYSANPIPLPSWRRYSNTPEPSSEIWAIAPVTVGCNHILESL